MPRDTPPPPKPPRDDPATDAADDATWQAQRTLGPAPAGAGAGNGAGAGAAPSAVGPTIGGTGDDRSVAHDAPRGAARTAAFDQTDVREQTVGLPDDTQDYAAVTPTPAGGPEEAEDWDRLPPPVFLPNAQVFGKYRLLKMLGEGGMGQVWLVDNLELDCKSALKLIRPEIAKNEKAWRRFKREAQVMAKLEHPNAIAVRAFHRTQSVAYIEMEYVRGESLDKVLEAADGKPMPLDWIGMVLDQLCSVLQEAHDHVDDDTGKPRPIIHRDLKPSNLMLLSKGTGQTLKVLDFGIAKMAGDDREAHLTGDAEYLGTAAYSSPEQIRGEAVDGRSDLYSAGVMLYQFLTGVLPFQGGARRSLVAHLTETPRPLREANPNVVIPEEIERLVLQCMEKSPDNRPRSARELADRFRKGLGTAAGGVGVGALPGGGGGAVVRPGAKPFPLTTVASAALVAAALTLVGFVAWKKPGLVGLASSSGRSGAGAGISPPPPPPVAPTAPEASTASASTAPTTPVVPARWPVPEGFKAVGSEIGSPDGPKMLERKDDAARFVRFEPGVYLPAGYEPRDRDDLRNGFPRLLVRTADDARFIRITGDTFPQGDFETPDDDTPRSDRQGNPCVKHWVKVSDFYMQETEVTNNQFQKFLNSHPGEIPEDALRDWRGYVKRLTDTVKDAGPYPAVWLGREAATKYASAVGGRLPTEAQWEFAARSGGQPNLFATKLRRGPSDKPLAYLRGEADETRPFPMPVMSYKAGRDETIQGLFDMTGNVREMCRDGYRPYDEIVGDSREKTKALVDPVIAADPAADGKGPKGVVRGGSFLRIPEEAYTFQRDGEDGLEGRNDLGFRLVIECPPKPVKTP